MATKPRARRKATNNPAASLIAALKFIEPAQKKVGPPNHQFCMFKNGWLVAYNDVLTIGTKVEEELNCFPHTIQLLDALGKAQDDLTISEVSGSALQVKSGAFTALIPCASLSDIPGAEDPFEIPPPDAPCAAIDDRIRAALDSVQVLATDGAPDAVCASVMLQAMTAVATNRHAIIEYWHGIDLPPGGMLLPKLSVQAIVKTKKPLVKFGYSDTSATFYFDDGSFIKTQLYKENWPAFGKVLDVPTNPFPLPAGFFTAVHAIESFSENGSVYFDKGVMSASRQVELATTYKVEGLSEDMAFNSKYLIMLELGIKTADFRPDECKMFFFGDNCRGCIMGLNMDQVRKDRDDEDKQTLPQSNRPTTGFDDWDDDIPF